MKWLGWAVLAYTLTHHLGLLPGGLGQVGEGTRLTDWVDLATPLLVLTPCGLALRALRATPVDWAWFGVGAVTYAQGQGIHLSANSVGNVAPGPTAHLWDEPVGHHVWFAGLALVVVALARVLARRPLPSPTWLGPVLGAVVGLTWGSNALGGGTEVMSLALAVVAALFAVRRRDTAVVVLLPAALTATVVVVVGWVL